jgi:hypothetical protein
MNAKTVIYAIIGGIAITLITGLLENTPAMMVGAVHYGYPFAWLVRMIVAPQYFPWVVLPIEFIADIVIWAIIVEVILLVATRRKKPEAN